VKQVGIHESTWYVDVLEKEIWQEEHFKAYIWKQTMLDGTGNHSESSPEAYMSRYE
jgi:hypothetical protein